MGHQETKTKTKSEVIKQERKAKSKMIKSKGNKERLMT
jgi:hypothetical protein